MVRIRQATVQDLDLLVPLFDGYRQFYRHPSEPDRIRRFLLDRFEHNQCVIFIAMNDEAAVGFTQLYPSFSSGALARIYVLNDLFVDARNRQSGVGKALLGGCCRLRATRRRKAINPLHRGHKRDCSGPLRKAWLDSEPIKSRYEPRVLLSHPLLLTRSRFGTANHHPPCLPCPVRLSFQDVEMLVFYILQHPAAGFVRDLECVRAALIREITRNRKLFRRKMNRHRDLLHHPGIHGSNRVKANHVRGRWSDDDRVFREDVDKARVALVDALLKVGKSAANRRFFSLCPLRPGSGSGRV